MRHFLVNASIVLIVLLAVALTGEVVVRLLQHNDYLVDYQKPNKKRKIQSQRPLAPKLIRSANPKLFVEVDPTDPQVNALGMRGPLPSKQKAEGVFRIAVIGDSVAFGFGVKDEESFPRQLEALLLAENYHVEVINFAVCGYGLEAYTEVYKTKANSFKPDLVVLGYVLNDPGRVSDFIQSVSTGMKLNARIKRVAKISQFAAWLMTSYYAALENITNTYTFRKAYFHKSTQAFIEENLRELHQQTIADQVPLVTFIFPYFHDMRYYPLEAAHQVVAGILAQQGIPYRDLLQDYRSHDGIALRLEEGDFTHPNAEGHRIAAEAIKAYLIKEKLLP